MSSKLTINDIPENVRYPIVHYRFAQGLLGVGGFFSVIVYNSLSKRPKYANPHMHVICTGLGVLLGTMIVNVKNSYVRKQQLIFEDYVALHPEEFDRSESKKFKDVLLSWNPIR